MIEGARREGERVVIDARVRSVSGMCPRCTCCSTRVHSRYRRRLGDAAVAGQQVVVGLQVRRFFCDNADCAAGTFAEQVAGLTVPYGRRTVVLRGMLEAIGLALAGRSGARLAGRLGLPIGRDTLLRLVRALPDPPSGEVEVLGVDDFATTRGQVYATIVIDHETRRPVDVLADREADTLATWLAEHPEVRVVTRDRAGSYAEACTRGAPQATQCADRWHLWKNLGEAVEKTVIAHRGCLPEPAAPPAADADIADATPPVPIDAASPASDGEHLEATQSRLEARFRERYDEIHRLRAEGKGMRTIGTELDLDRKTVRRFLHTDSVEELLAKTTSRITLLDEHQTHLHQRWNEGCTDVARLVEEIRAQGYRGSARTVYRYLQPFRGQRKTPDPVPAPPKIRHVVGWIMRDPQNLDGEQQQQLNAVLARCPELEVTRRRVGAFAHMIRDLRGDLLPEWIERVRDDNLPALHSFVTGLQQDEAAVTAGLTLAPSNGRTEGTVNRIKTLKRGMFGRANLDLLRKRILLA